MLGQVCGIDVAARAVLIEGGRSVPYDYVILATGARHAYFGHDDWGAFRAGLKRIEDATEIRPRWRTTFLQSTGRHCRRPHRLRGDQRGPQQ
jgi:NADH dehydrogenase